METEEQTLRTLYVDQKQPCSAIAEVLGKSEWWVISRLKKFKIPIRSRGGSRLIDLSGLRFGKWSVMTRSSKQDDDNTRWIVRCDCGVVKDLAKGNLTSGRSKSCEKCRAFAPSPKGRKLKNYRGIEDLSMQYWINIQNGAKKRKIHFDLDIRECYQLYLNQNKKCALTGLPIVFCRGYSESKGAQTASLDRIDSTQGYVKGNVRWLHKSINIMKWHFPDDYFLELCHKVVDHSKA